jgi:uncharacterized membrane protein
MTALPFRPILLTAAGASFALGIGFVIVKWPQIAAAGGRGHGLHAPDLPLLLAQPPVVVIHVALALAALVLGPAMLLSRKGAGFHRKAGWTWAGLMAGVAVSSFFLNGLATSFSYIHVMSGLTLLLLPLAMHAARSHRVGRHRALMLWLFYVMLLGAGLFTLVPGRLMWRLVFG